MFTGAEGEDIAFFLTSFPDRFQTVLERRRNKKLQEGKNELLKTIINLKKVTSILNHTNSLERALFQSGEEVICKETWVRVQEILEASTNHTEQDRASERGKKTAASGDPPRRAENTSQENKR